MTTNITKESSEAFESLTKGDRQWTLVSCFVDGAPAAAICRVIKHGRSAYIFPVFVSVTESMQLTDQNGVPVDTGE